MRFETLPVLLILMISLISVCPAQNTVETNNLSLDNNLVSWYDSTVGYEHTQLFIGTLAFPEKVAEVGFPNHRSASWIDGDIKYRGGTFVNVSMIYDLHQDLLYLKNTASQSYSIQPILLIQNQVEWFELDGDYFRYIPDAIGLLQPGFFQVVYQGENLSLIVKRSKIVKIGGNKGASEYQNFDRYFLKDESYHRLKNRSSLLKVFPEHKKEIRRYIRQNKLKVLKPGYDHHMSQVIQYCESLIRK